MAPRLDSGRPWRTLLSGVIVGALIGYIWNRLYWRGDGAYPAVLVATHAALGAIYGGLTWTIGRRLPSWANGFAVTGAVLGSLWLAPIVLFLIDFRFFDVRSDTVGVAASLLVVCCSALTGAWAGARPRPIVRVVLLATFAAAGPMVSYMAMPGPVVPPITILNRIGDAVPDVPPMVERDRRVMVLGVDGATWSVIDPLLEEGKLENFRALMSRGSYGVLESVRTESGETASPVVWTSMFTGMTPNHHGVRDWLVSDSRNRTKKSLWNILNQNGDIAIVVNVPGTFPPERVLGAMVSGFPMPAIARPDSGRLQLSVGRFYSSEDTALSKVPVSRIEFASPSNATADSFSPPQSAELSIVEHLETRHGRLKHRAYDFRFGNLFLELVERRGLVPAHNLASFSLLLRDTTDDGVENHDIVDLVTSTGQVVTSLHQGDWTDWLSVHVRGAELFFKLHVVAASADGASLYATPLFQSSARPVIPFTYPLRLAPRLHNDVGQYIVESAGWLIFEDEPLLTPLYEHTLDAGIVRSRAAAYLLGEIENWSLFVHIFTEPDRVQHPFWRFHEPEAYDDSKPSLVSEHGQRVRQTMIDVDRRLGELLSHVNDDTIVAVVSDHGFRAGPSTGRGDHEDEGIYILAGPGIRASGQASQASVLDLTPTLLHVAGYPVARDMDGHVLIDLLDDALKSCCTVRFIDTYESDGDRAGSEQVIDESTLEQLRSLGYVQ